MVKPNPKREKREETTEEFVRNINQKGGKRNGKRRNYTWQKRRHGV